MIENEKIDCVDSLIFGLNRTAQWRQKMAAQYPGDPRNVRAADCLLKLASDATELSDGTWSQLRLHCGWANERWRESISQAAGFAHKTRHVIERYFAKISKRSCQLALLGTSHGCPAKQDCRVTAKNFRQRSHQRCSPRRRDRPTDTLRLPHCFKYLIPPKDRLANHHDNR
jgi:hypothetical protein